VAIRVCFIRIHEFPTTESRPAAFALNVGERADVVKGGRRRAAKLARSTENNEYLACSAVLPIRLPAQARRRPEGPGGHAEMIHPLRAAKPSSARE
jgi:hypothetical protein